MRSCPPSRSSLLTDAQSAVYGINLGSDHCAEHEWGIQDLEHMAGLPIAACTNRSYRVLPDRLGLAARTNTLVPPMRVVADQEIAILILGDQAHRSETRKDSAAELADICHVAPNRLWDKRKRKATGAKPMDPAWRMSCAWDQRNLAIALPVAQRQVLDDLVAAFERHDASIHIGGGGPFGGHGLVISIVSRVPAEQMQVMRDADRETWEDWRAITASGVEERLKAAGLGWYALSPMRSPKPFDCHRGVITSPSGLYLFLNPQDQQNHASGWYTVEELLDWAAHPAAGAPRRRQHAKQQYDQRGFHERMRSLKLNWFGPEVDLDANGQVMVHLHWCDTNTSSHPHQNQRRSYTLDELDAYLASLRAA